MVNSYRRFVLYLCLGVACPVLVTAQDGGPRLDYGIGYRAEYHDNITLAPDSETQVEDWFHAPFLDFALSRTGRVSADVEGVLEYFSYNDDTFRSEVRSNLSADVTWRLSEERFHWVVTNDLARSPINQLSFDVPDNEQQTNIFATGPDVILRLSQSDQLILGARYLDFYVQDTDEDYDGWDGSIAWLRRTGETSAYGLRLSNSTARFDNVSLVNSDYDRSELAAHFETDTNLGGKLGRWVLNVGYTEIDFDNAPRGKVDSPLVSVSYELLDQSTGTLSVNLVNEISNIGQDLGSLGEVGSTTIPLQTAVTGDPFTRTRLGIEWSRRNDRLTVFMDGFYDTQDYEVDSLDQDFYGIAVGTSYRVRPLATLIGRVGFEKTEFKDFVQEDERLTATLGLRIQRTRNWSYDFALNWFDRDSTDQNFVADDLALSARVTYRRQ